MRMLFHRFIEDLQTEVLEIEISYNNIIIPVMCHNSLCNLYCEAAVYRPLVIYIQLMLQCNLVNHALQLKTSFRIVRISIFIGRSYFMPSESHDFSI